MKTNPFFYFVLSLLFLAACSSGTKAQQNQSLTDTDTAIESPIAEETDQADPKYISPDSAEAEGVRIEKGANLVDALKAASKVSYDYDADSGIWAHIGKVSIVIDEDQLNDKGTDYMATITSDIETDLAFSPDYIKPEAKILRIEED